jgi:hypothetical protein
MASETFHKGPWKTPFGARTGRVLLLASLVLSLAFSCTPPDRGIVVDGSLGGGAGESAGSGGALGGAASGGASFGGAGGDVAPSGGGTPGSGGAPLACEDSGDCNAPSAPICDEDSGDCRACDSGAECEAADPAAPVCSAEGTCVECISDDECSSAEPVCADGNCRGCAEHSECESLVCAIDGTCVEQTAVVYALAATGSYDSACGALDLPCRRFSDAMGHLGASRPYLVLIPTTEAFDEGSEGALVWPSGVDVTILGNSVEVLLTADPGIAIAGGGSVRLDQLVLAGTGPLEADPDQVLLHVTGGELEITGSVFKETQTSIAAYDAAVRVFDSTFSDVAGGVDVICTTDCAGVPAPRLERNRFENVSWGAISAQPAGAYIANNLLVETALETYSTGITVKAEAVVEFNTLVRSGNCGYNSLINCSGSGIVLRGNITHECTTLGLGGGTPCYGQIYSSLCPSPEYSLGEVTLPGTGNAAGDPLFVDDDGGDFHLSSDSPAVDRAPSAASDLENDLEGNPRPVGDGKDAGSYERQ